MVVPPPAARNTSATISGQVKATRRGWRGGVPREAIPLRGGADAPGAGGPGTGSAVAIGA